MIEFFDFMLVNTNDVARALPDKRLAHPEDRNGEKFKKISGKNEKN